MLSINSEKSEFLLVPSNDDNLEVFIMTHKGNIITGKKKVKILGVKFNSRNTMETHVSSLASNIGMKYKELKPIIKDADLKDRKLILTAKLTSTVLYAAPLFLGESTSCKKWHQDILMRINKWIFSKPTYMVNHEAICSEINLGTPNQTILKAHVKHITKILYEKEVHPILEQLVMKEHLGSTRPEVSEADPWNQRVTRSKVSRLRPAHRNSKVNM